MAKFCQIWSLWSVIPFSIFVRFIWSSENAIRQFLISGKLQLPFVALHSAVCDFTKRTYNNRIDAKLVNNVAWCGYT